MKRAIFAVFLGLALAWPAMGQEPLYENDGVVNTPITIDAITFVNNGLFEIPVTGFVVGTNFSLLDIILINTTTATYDFSDVVNYTNRGTMACDTGFNFDTAPSDAGVRHRAANFVNANPGQIFCGTLNGPFNTNFVFIVAPKLNISASNVVNSGFLDVGVNGLLTLGGGSVNLTRGTLHVEGIDDLGGMIGVFSRDWGFGTESNLLSLANVTLPASTPFALATNFAGALQVALAGLPTAFANTNIIDTNNFTFQAVFVGDGVGQTTIDVRFLPAGDFAIPIVQWSSVVTNPFSGQISTNTLYLEDTLGVITNMSLVTNGFTLLQQPEVAPTNYFVFRSFPGFSSLPVGNTPFSTTLFSNAFDTNAPFATTNQYTAYGVDVLPVTFVPQPNLPGQTITNVGGRIELTADTVMDMTRVKIAGPNYLRVTSTNHWVGSSNAQISVPFIDLNLGSTNGNMDITNVVAPFITHFNGPIDAYSAKWTNTFSSNSIVTNITGTGTNVTTNAFTVTNRYHVLMVLSFLSNTAPVFSQSVSLRSTNVIISDILNISNSLLINAQNLTITTNAPGAVTPVGEINLLSPNILWSSSLPTLQNLTNFGLITTLNSVFFQQRLTPDFPSPSDGPYQTFVNHGSISTAGGETIWANYFENSGPSGANPSISAGFGPINVQATNALITNGTFTASAGDITIGGGSIIIGNQALAAPAGALTLNVTGQLTDGSAVGNLFTISDGINLPIKPTSGDLLGTTVMIQAPAGVEVEDVWAGADLGAVAAGYSNNAALGHLVLSGGDVTSAFHFAAAGAQNALYVDQLEFQGSTSNAAALDIDPNMTIYFASALLGGSNISTTLDGANGGRIRKVPGFVGLFKTGSSSGGGVQLSITMTNLPPVKALISWQAVPNATNGLYSSTSVGGSNWTLVTNLVQGASSSVVTVPQPVQANGSLFYKVRINPIH